MINSFSVASSHSPAAAGAATGAGATAITLHFNYNNNNTNNNNNNNSNNKSNNINNSNNSGITIIPANEHKSHKNFAPTATTTAKMFKVTQNEVEAKHFKMTYPQQQQQQQQGIAVKWMSANKTGKVINTSGSTKEAQFIQVNIQSSNKQQFQTTRATAKSAFIEVLSMPQQQQQKQRTEDQENAFRQIEDVHNYAKLQHHHHHNLNHNSSSDELGDEDEDDDEDDEEEKADERKEELHIVDVNVNVITTKNNVNVPNFNVINENSDEHIEVDVVTVTPPTKTHRQEKQKEQLLVVDQDMRPEHHARRPMNAFLIFCKRHRAIVKERYKSLENRAITKILGDWWAALDDLEKQCFTDLAQQNKDAFFNANPNFKWYKLPAPPLRTLATRPSNTVASHLNEEQLQEQQLQWESNEVADMLRRNYFKFADETQMGELSVLLSGNAAGNLQDKDNALQQALSETTQFLSAHMPGKNHNNKNNKRGLQTGDSRDSSNSSEEEERGSSTKKLKSSRSCKGKIYQQLINSGQLAAIAKKSGKCRLNSGGSNSTLDANSNTPPISPTTSSGAEAGAAATTADCSLLELEIPVATEIQHKIASSSMPTAAEFDLEEKIKELPALCLDDYLQRKRSTKKKKKFSSSKKQRNSNSVSSSSATSSPPSASAGVADNKSINKCDNELAPQLAAAVGSQKRKARKESITRRDVSAIEQVASILPLTINGSYYFNQSQLLLRTQPTKTTASGTRTTASTTKLLQQDTIVDTSPPLSSSSSTLSAYEQSTYDATSTSDLLILAEVAANRTELTKSN